MEPDAANPPRIELFSSKLHTFAPPCAAVWYGSKKLDGSVVFKFGSTQLIFACWSISRVLAAVEIVDVNTDDFRSYIPWFSVGIDPAMVSWVFILAAGTHRFSQNDLPPSHGKLGFHPCSRNPPVFSERSSTSGKPQAVDGMLLGIDWHHRAVTIRIVMIDKSKFNSKSCLLGLLIILRHWWLCFVYPSHAGLSDIKLEEKSNIINDGLIPHRSSRFASNCIVSIELLCHPPFNKRSEKT